MKTIEEKAKAYDEALERAKEFEKGEVHFALTPGESIVHWIFPELCESEDERIRKGLIQHLKELRDWKVGTMSPIKASSHYDAWIAYLEKQKDLFESGRGLYYYDGEKTTYCGYPATEENPYDFAMSQKEKQKEQKPAWSEKDEKMRNLALDWAETLAGQCSFVGINPTDFRKIISWLKSLRPQPKQEWSEEDEEIIANAIKQLYSYANSYHNANNDTREKEVRKVADKLQSLYPQSKQGKKGLILTKEQEKEFGHLFTRPSWKPSEEQMSMLLAVINDPNNAGAESCQLALREIYRQLKKL